MLRENSRASRDLLACGGDTDDCRNTPSLVACLESGTHHVDLHIISASGRIESGSFTYVSSAVESVIQSAVREFNQEVLYALPLGQFRRIDEVGCTHLGCPSLLVRIRVDRDDTRRADEGGSLNDPPGQSHRTRRLPQKNPLENKFVRLIEI